MPQPQSRVLRTLVPLIAILAGIGIVIAVARNTASQKVPAQPAAASTATPTETPPAQPAAPPPADTDPAAPATPAAVQTPGASTTTPAQSPSVPPTAATAQPGQPGLLDGLRAQVFPADTPAPAPLGSLDPASDSRFQIEFSPSGAGIASLRLADHFETVKKTNHVQLQAEHSIETATSKVSAAPFGMTFAQISTPGAAAPLATVNLYWDAAGPLWRQTAPDKPGSFEAQIVNSAGTPVIRLERTYRLAAGRHDVLIDQRITNLTQVPLVIQLSQFGPSDLPNDSMGYGGDKRRVRFGYLLKPAADPARQSVMAADFVIPRDKELGAINKTTGVYEPTRRSWPREESIKNGYELVWAGLTNRYFGVAVYPPLNVAAGPVDKSFRQVHEITRLVLDPGHVSKSDRREVLNLALNFLPLQLAPGAAADLNLAVYAGPLAKKEILSDPLTKEAGLDGLIVYNFGGPCGSCTFDFITAFLIWLLRTLHNYVVFDWALAIIVLVVCVRSILHPVTRWSQIRMQRFGKQMQSIQPKQKKLQEKYKDDRQKLQQETAKLWKEEGISPMGMLGCLPMLLQTPVWIALYATLYFAVELRHQPAFFGVFQAIDKNWSFLADLAEPDRFVYFAKAYHIPLLSGLFGAVTSVNILPIILGVVFFIHQKFMTPPMTNMTPEQEAQQKMVKWMSVFMFPLFMYNAPSGLATYFIANSTLGIFENMWIRKDIEKHGLADVEKMRAQRQARAAKGGGGWMQKMQQMAEAQRAAAEKRARQSAKKR